MPALVALAIRAIIQMAVMLGVSTLAEKYLLPMLNQGIAKLMELLGVDEEDAKDIMANGFIEFAEQLGIGVLLLRSKLPTKLAERLGFTSKGFAKRALSTKATTAIERATKAGIILPGSAPTTATEVAQITAKARGLSLDTVSKVASLIIAGIGVPVGVGLLITNTIDFGAWSSSAYQNQFQKFLSIFGLEADKSYTNSKVLDQEKFTKVYNTYKELGAVGINNPYENMSQEFTKDNLGRLLDKVAAHIIAEKNQATIKDVFAATTAFIITREPVKTQTTTATPTQTQQVAPVSNVKVFTGTLAQGVLGDQAQFQTREDDLIENAEDLNSAMKNNLVSFISALPARIVYEVKIVSSVQTKDGFTRQSQTQTVIRSYTKDGKPIYKTVTNRWAIVNIYAITSKGVRTKLETITLGPTDAVKFQPTTNELQSVEQNIKSQIYTTDIAEIQGIKTTSPITVSQPTTSTQTVIQQYELRKKQEELIQKTTGDTGLNMRIVTDRELGKLNRGEISLTEYNSRMSAAGYADFKDPKKKGEIEPEPVVYQPNYGSPIYQTPTSPTSQTTQTTTQAATTTPTQSQTQQQTAPSVPSVSLPPSSNPNRQNAQTIAEFFDPNKIVYPSVSERAKLYEAFGLGSASYYTGTGEQNNKLLAELKKRY